MLVPFLLLCPVIIPLLNSQCSSRSFLRMSAPLFTASRCCRLLPGARPIFRFLFGIGSVPDSLVPGIRPVAYWFWPVRLHISHSKKKALQKKSRCNATQRQQKREDRIAAYDQPQINKWRHYTTARQKSKKKVDSPSQESNTGPPDYTSGAVPLSYRTDATLTPQVDIGTETIIWARLGCSIGRVYNGRRLKQASIHRQQHSNLARATTRMETKAGGKGALSDSYRAPQNVFYRHSLWILLILAYLLFTFEI